MLSFYFYKYINPPKPFDLDEYLVWSTAWLFAPNH
jgi:hypothetical protein